MPALPSLQHEKLSQASALCGELGFDAWLTVGRETGMNTEPALPLIAGVDFTATAAVIVTPSRSITVAGHNDAEGVRQLALFDEVLSYDTSFAAALGPVLQRLAPSCIALNWSTDDVAADGLSHGLYLALTEIFTKQGYGGRVVSAAPLIAKLRGRKSPREVQAMRRAIAVTDEIYAAARGFIRAGVTERQIFDFFHGQMTARGVQPSWQASQCPGVMVGPGSAVGHNGPTEIAARPGDVMDIDFGVRADGYSSDLQRVYYVAKPGETRACDEVRDALAALQEAVRRAAAFIRPGVTGREVDAVARDYVVSRGYASWNYALGHQVGAFAHDGGTILAPRWDRYEPWLVETPVEAGNVFTMEPGTRTSRGYVGVEEMVLVTETGGELLTTMQDEAWVVGG